jgi:hypothetical protein
MVNQAKLHSYRTAPKYQYRYEVQKSYSHAVTLDKKNGNTKWQDAAKVEMDQLHEYETFHDQGHTNVKRTPEGYKKICVHLVLAVKYDGRHKEGLVADSHFTEVPLYGIYSGVVSL